MLMLSEETLTMADKCEDNFIISIPKELQLHILSLLSHSDLMSVSLTCRRLKDAARDPALWRKLTLEYERIKNKTVACREHVSRCTSLKEIFIKGNTWNSNEEKIMSVFMKAKDTLTSIDISSRISVSSLKKISKMTQLRKLAFRAEKVKVDGIYSLASLIELRSLEFRWINVEYMNEWANLFTHLKKLEEVELYYISDEVVERLVVNNPNLCHLNISGSPRLTSLSVNLIAENCSQLTHLEIALCFGFSSSDIQKLIRAFPKLTHANFSCTKIDDTTLGLLSQNCPELESLNLFLCENVSELGVEGFITATGKLKYLNIRHLGASNPGFAKRVDKEHPNIQIVHSE